MDAFVNKNLTNEIWYIIKWTEYNWKGNDYIDMFADIQWVWDYDFSDKNINYWYEAFKLVAVEIAAIAAWAVTMW
jgi:hypothetical protein